MTVPRGWRYHERLIKLWSGGTTTSRRWTKHRGRKVGLDIKGWDCLKGVDCGMWSQGLHGFGVLQSEAGFVAVLVAYFGEHGRLPTRAEVEALPQLEVESKHD